MQLRGYDHEFGLVRMLGESETEVKGRNTHTMNTKLMISGLV